MSKPQLVSYLKTGKDKKREGRLQVMLMLFTLYFCLYLWPTSDAALTIKGASSDIVT